LEDPLHARGRARGVSLWLQPQGPFRERLRSVVDRLAARFGGPVLEPHVTLVAGLPGDEGEILQRAQALAATLQPLSLRLERVARRDEYFRALFVEAIGGEPLHAAHAAACRGFGHRPAGPFQPHLSLAYGRLDPAAVEAAGREISNEVQGRFESAALHVVRTEGPVADWRELAVVPFGQP
jgi:2'-5' RNA ligase